MADVEVYDPAINTWETKAPLPKPRGLLCAAVVDGKIFAIGSSLPPNGPWSRTVEMYDPASDTWSKRTDMPSARGALACAAVNGRIYVIGGRDGGSIYAANEEYDPETDNWIKRAPIRMTDSGGQTALASLSTTALNGRIYAIGGQRNIGGISERLVLEYTPPIVTPEVRLVVAATELGTVFVSPLMESYTAGAEVTVTAEPERGFELVKWTYGGEEFTTNPATIVIKEGATLVPIFARKVAEPISIDIAPAMAITWNSQEGKTYEILSSTDLENWVVEVEGIEGTGENSTQFFLRTTSEIYYRVAETP